MSNIPFQTINWDAVAKVAHTGDTGMSYWQTVQFEGLRIRTVTYESGYLADHWCKKGHIVYCLEGEFESELENDTTITLSKGMMYVVSDNLSTHRSYSKIGVKLLIIDGNFLQNDSSK
jgi:hypothetical protein